jgi:hypothetical protein
MAGRTSRGRGQDQAPSSVFMSSVFIAAELTRWDQGGAARGRRIDDGQRDYHKAPFDRCRRSLDPPRARTPRPGQPLPARQRRAVSRPANLQLAAPFRGARRHLYSGRGPAGWHPRRAFRHPARYASPLLIVSAFALPGWNDQKWQVLFMVPFGVAWVVAGYALLRQQRSGVEQGDAG